MGGAGAADIEAAVTEAAVIEAAESATARAESRGTKRESMLILFEYIQRSLRSTSVWSVRLCTCASTGLMALQPESLTLTSPDL